MNMSGEFLKTLKFVNYIISVRNGINNLKKKVQRPGGKVKKSV